MWARSGQRREPMAKPKFYQNQCPIANPQTFLKHSRRNPTEEEKERSLLSISLSFFPTNAIQGKPSGE
ncbi:hypothetical protein ACLOJK_000448 [Asimina triloba]